MEQFFTICSGITRCIYAPGEVFTRNTVVIDPAMLGGTPCEAPESPILRVEFEKRPIYQSLLDGKPKVRVVQTADGQKTQIENLSKVYVRDAWRAKIYLRFEPDEHIYGFGQDEAGAWDKRGRLEYLYQHNMRIPMPMFVSSRGYAILADCGCLMTFDSREDTTVWTLECVDQADLYLLRGSMDEIIGHYRELTGRAAPMPDWALGYWQSKEKYNSQEELLETARRYRELQIPLDVVVQDWQTWVGDLWGDKHLDHSRYPDLCAMKREMESMHVHTLVSIWPNVEEGGKDHRELAERNMLLSDYSTYNAFDPAARQFYWKQVDRELVRGFDGWWCDNTEPFASPDWCGSEKRAEETRWQLVGGAHETHLDPAKASLYAVAHAQGIYENQPAKPVVNLTRSGWAGIQKYGVVLWAGDTSASWQELRREIAKGLSISLCGIPYWTVDAGAFFVKNRPELWFWSGDYDGGVEDLGYQELYTRWLQFACFLPVFRSHGTDTPREVWNFSQPFRQVIEETIRLRYRLMPYLRNMARRVTDEHFTILRSLLFDFPREPESAMIDDEYMFGQDLLVCPVTEPMCFEAGSRPLKNPPKTKKCWLPAGADWYDFWTGDRYQGGQYVECPLTLRHIPLFVRAGAFLPMQEELQYAEDLRPVTDIHFRRTGD